MQFVHDFSVIYRFSCVLEGVPALTLFQGAFEKDTKMIKVYKHSILFYNAM